MGRLVNAAQEATQGNREVAFADQGDNGEKAAAAASDQAVEPVIVRLPEAKKGFVLLPIRWIAERSLAWTTRFRRLVRHYERYASTLAGLHFVAFACLMLKQAAQAAVGRLEAAIGSAGRWRCELQPVPKGRLDDRTDSTPGRASGESR